MITSRYMVSVKNLPAIMQKIVDGTAPANFNRDHLKGLGFKSSTNRAVIPLLKDLGFLSGDGAPTERYHAYRDSSRSREVMGEALLEAYDDLFTISEKPATKDRKAVEGKIKSTHNVSDRVATLQTMTFFALLKLADLDAARGRADAKAKPEAEEEAVVAAKPRPKAERRRGVAEAPGLRYNIEIHLPATKDVDVYNAIFKSLKEHLLEH